MSNIHMALTLKGQALNAKIQAGGGNVPLHITRIVSAAGYSNDPLSLNNVIDMRQTAIIARREVIGVRAAIEITLSNQGNPAAGEQGLTVGYSLSQFGMFANDPDEGEILYRISQFDSPTFVPAASEMGWTINPTWNFIVGNASEVIVEVDPSGMATIGQLQRHIDDSVNLPEGVHGLRHFAGGLQVFDGEEWSDVSMDVDAIVPNTFIASAILTGSSLSLWGLYRNVGGIRAPLEMWGFTNATLVETPSRVSVDIKNNMLSIFATSEFAGRSWAVEQYDENTIILTATDGVSLILVRR